MPHLGEFTIKKHALLTDPAQLHAPKAHASSHESGGADELDLTGLSGGYSLAQLKTDHPTLSGAQLHDPKAHASSHESGEADEIDVTGLTGLPDPSAYNVFKTANAYNSILQGTWTIADTDTYFLGIRWYNTTAADGDGVRYKISHKAGSFTLVIIGQVHTGNAIMDILIDGVSQGTIDWYGTANNFVEKTKAITILTDGEHTLDLKINGKNASSATYYLNWAAFWIRD